MYKQGCAEDFFTRGDKEFTWGVFIIRPKVVKTYTTDQAENLEKRIISIKNIATINNAIATVNDDEFTWLDIM